MAVFRSDQAQVTFAAEAAQGGDMERLGAASSNYASSGNSYLTIATNPGETSITVTYK